MSRDAAPDVRPHPVGAGTTPGGPPSRWVFVPLLVVAGLGAAAASAVSVGLLEGIVRPPYPADLPEDRRRFTAEDHARARAAEELAFSTSTALQAAAVAAAFGVFFTAVAAAVPGLRRGRGLLLRTPAVGAAATVAGAAGGAAAAATILHAPAHFGLESRASGEMLRAAVMAGLVLLPAGLAAGAGVAFGGGRPRPGRPRPSAAFTAGGGAAVIAALLLPVLFPVWHTAFPQFSRGFTELPLPRGSGNRWAWACFAAFLITLAVARAAVAGGGTAGAGVSDPVDGGPDAADPSPLPEPA